MILSKKFSTGMNSSFFAAKATVILKFSNAFSVVDSSHRLMCITENAKFGDKRSSACAPLDVFCIVDERKEGKIHGLFVICKGFVKPVCTKKHFRTDH